MPDTTPKRQERHDDANWAALVSSLQVSRVPTGSLNLNVEGRAVVGPLQGFGRLWQKTFRLDLSDIAMTPIEVMQIWKANFASFQPAYNRFYPVTGIAPGEVVLINASATGMPLSTGVMVLYADEESFTLMTPQGHPESGWVTFSTSLEESGLLCQVQTISRANDPIYEIGFRLFASRTQDRIWTHVLEALAAHLYALAASSPEQEAAQEDDKGERVVKVQVSKICLDPRVQWSEAKNIWQNAAMRTAFYTFTTPIRWLMRRVNRRKDIQK